MDQLEIDFLYLARVGPIRGVLGVLGVRGVLGVLGVRGDATGEEVKERGDDVAERGEDASEVLLEDVQDLGEEDTDRGDDVADLGDDRGDAVFEFGGEALGEVHSERGEGDGDRDVQPIFKKRLVTFIFEGEKWI